MHIGPLPQDEENMFLLQDAQNTVEYMYKSIVEYWLTVHSLYGSNNLNALYGYLYNNEITINIAGVRLGYYSFILPTIDSQYAAKGIIFNDTYNPLQDTAYLNEQGITQAMITELMAAMSSQNNDNTDDTEGGE